MRNECQELTAIFVTILKRAKTSCSSLILFLSQPANPTSFAILFIAANNR